MNDEAITTSERHMYLAGFREGKAEGYQLGRIEMRTDVLLVIEQSIKKIQSKAGDGQAFAVPFIDGMRSIATAVSRMT